MSKVGQSVLEDQVLAAVMTDKATVEIPSPVAGTVVALGGEVGSVLAVGAELVRLEVAGAGNDEVAAAPREAAAPPQRRRAPKRPRAPVRGQKAPHPLPPPAPAPPVDAAPRSRRRGRRSPSRSPRPPCAGARAMPASTCARCAAADRRAGSATRISTPSCAVRRRRAGSAARAANTEVETVKIIGLRRRIAQKMAESKRRIAHFSYVEEVDVTALEELRATLNAENRPDRPRLTLMPFLMQALVKAIADFPEMNALYDDEAETIERLRRRPYRHRHADRRRA